VSVQLSHMSSTLSYENCPLSCKWSHVCLPKDAWSSSLPLRLNTGTRLLSAQPSWLSLNQIMSFICTAPTFVEVVPHVPLHLARGFIHLFCDSTQAHACGRPASWLSLRSGPTCAASFRSWDSFIFLVTQYKHTLVVAQPLGCL